MERNRARRRAFVFWDPAAAARNVNTVLSNSNRTVTTTGTPDTQYDGRSTTIIPVGTRRYVEFTVNVAAAAHDVGIGLANVSKDFSVTGELVLLGSDANSLGYYNGTGLVFLNNVQVGSITAFAAGDVIGMDCTAGGTVAFRVNGGAFSAGFDISTLGAVYLAYAVRNTGQVTVNFGPTYRDTPPSGAPGFPW